MDLKSSVNKLGKTVTQIIHFSGGNKRTFNGIITESIKQGEFTKFNTTDGRLVMINTNNVDCVEVFVEQDIESDQRTDSLIKLLDKK